MVVRAEEPSTLISFTLMSAKYHSDLESVGKKALGDARAGLSDDDARIRRALLLSPLDTTGLFSC